MRLVKIIILYVSLISPLYAAVVAEKTPNDVYQKVLLLTEDVKQLRQKNNISTPWPKVNKEDGLAPRHVYQKALEILEKINRYRVNILKIGAITVPAYPNREITPNEVYDFVLRLRAEIRLLNNNPPISPEIEHVKLLKTPTDVYQRLAEISISLDETLGLRSISPSEVYQRSLQVLDMAQFIRRTQNTKHAIKKPLKNNKLLPNHALKEVNLLLHKIRLVEQNLWIKPIKKYSTPHRVITPGDVYDAMGIVLAELKRISYRLGFEHELKIVRSQEGKKPEDVAQNTQWAKLLLPEFDFSHPLQQYNKSSLQKNSSHVFAITEKILKQLRAYLKYRGISASLYIPDLIDGIQPTHVFSKTLALLEKTRNIRQQNKIGDITVPDLPLRKITPAEVYTLSIRLDKELAFIFASDGFKTTNIPDEDIGLLSNKAPQDVYQNIQRIEIALDIILGDFAYSVTDVYQEVLLAKAEALLLTELLLNKKVSVKAKRIPTNILAKDIYKKSIDILQLIKQIKQRAGFYSNNLQHTARGAITASDIYNQASLIHTDLISIKAHLGIDKKISPLPAAEHKTITATMYELENLELILNELLHKGTH